MKNLLVVASLVSAWVPAAAVAQSVFDGTWKTDIKTIDYPAKPIIYEIKGGMFECTTCAFKAKVKTDGKDQKVEGNPYADTMAVKIVDDRGIESWKVIALED